MALDSELLDRVLNSPQLPSLPAIAIEIIGMVQQDDVDVDKIAQTISLDPALSSKLLKTVNSSFYGLPQTVGSVHQAVIVLGLNSVKTLALGFSLVSNLAEAGGEGFDHMAFWRRSLFCATAAKLLCDKLHIVQAEEVFMASLLQDVGVQALAQVLGQAYAELMQRTEGDHRKLSEIERQELGSDHTDIGAALAESWNLPPLLTESIRLHEKADEVPENLRPLIRTVSAGAYAAELIEHPDDEQRVGEFHRVLNEWFELGKDDADALVKSVFKHAHEMQRLFELPTGDLGHSEDILVRANRALERLSLDSVKQNAELLQANEQLKAQANQDVVTGLQNRRQFDERLDEFFLAAGPSQPLSVVFIDIDQFKQVNDTHGHLAGDELLRAVAIAMQGAAGDKGEVFRYGGDEFAVLCPGLSRADAARLAEVIRRQIEQTQCDVGEDGKTQLVSLTASIGVASYDSPVFKRADQLIKAADKGVYAAKHGGRNAVRVFVPKGGGKSQAA